MKKFLLIIFAVSSFNFAQFATWEYYGNMKMPVAGGDIWQDIDNFYVFGGYSDSLQVNVNWVQKFRVYFDTWKLDSMNSPRFGLVTKRYGNYAYLFGGIFEEASSIDGIEKWGIDSFDQTISFNKNFNRIFSTGHIIGDNFYIFGGNPLPGTISDSLPYIAKYNLIESAITYQSDTIFTSGDLPEQQMSEVIGNDIFIFGGVINGISQDIYKFNIIDSSFVKLDIQLLEPRAGGRAIIGADPNRIYIIGGYNENSQALNTVEIFSAYGDQYFIEESPPIQDARYNFMSALLDGNIYILGGFDNEGKVISSIERLGDAATTENSDNSLSNSFTKFELYQNYPNPFNPATIIKYSVPVSDANFASAANVQLTVYDVLGNEIATLVDKKQPPGIYEISFEASTFPSGVYFYQLKSGQFIQTRKMILLR